MDYLGNEFILVDFYLVWLEEFVIMGNLIVNLIGLLRVFIKVFLESMRF